MNRPDVLRTDTPKQMLEKCGGWYDCPKDANDKRLGPLVGYAGTYRYGGGGVMKQFVGEQFADYAMIEQWPAIADHFVIPRLMSMSDEVSRGFKITVFCGAPEGGKSIAQTLAAATGLRYVYPEKIEDREVKAAEGDRAPTKLAFGRHRVHQGDRVAIVEDVCNNFSTTAKLIREIEQAGGTVTSIMCFLNRSTEWRDAFRADGKSWPIVALWNEAMPQYEQDSPYVLDDMRAQNYIAKPKLEIARLQEVMRQHA
jgi:adenine/guanine phosphoribosyltransferase-like PRPP-binding protein